MLELPQRDPCDRCDRCEGIAGRQERRAIIEGGDHTLTVINPWQFEVGQCCVVTRRHVATLLDPLPAECAAVLVAAQRVAGALLRAFAPLVILSFQNHGVHSGQETPHFHFHGVPRQEGSDWAWDRRSSPPSMVSRGRAARSTIRAATRSVARRGCRPVPGSSSRRRR